MFPTLLRSLTFTITLLASLALAQPYRPVGFSFNQSSGVSNRLIAPYGKNRYVVFSFSNPRDSNISGSVYDLQGKFVSSLDDGPTPGTTLRWNGKSNGQVVPTGVYIYVIQGEEKIFSGTVVVIQ